MKQIERWLIRILAFGALLLVLLHPMGSASAKTCYDASKNPIPCPQSDYRMTQEAIKKAGPSSTPVPDTATFTPVPPTATNTPIPATFTATVPASATSTTVSAAVVGLGTPPISTAPTTPKSGGFPFWLIMLLGLAVIVLGGLGLSRIRKRRIPRGSAQPGNPDTNGSPDTSTDSRQPQVDDNQDVHDADGSEGGQPDPGVGRPMFTPTDGAGFISAIPTGPGDPPASRAAPVHLGAMSVESGSGNGQRVQVSYEIEEDTGPVAAPAVTRSSSNAGNPTTGRGDILTDAQQAMVDIEARDERDTLDTRRNDRSPADVATDAAAADAAAAFPYADNANTGADQDVFVPEGATSWGEDGAWHMTKMDSDGGGGYTDYVWTKDGWVATGGNTGTPDSTASGAPDTTSSGAPGTTASGAPDSTSSGAPGTEGGSTTTDGSTGSDGSSTTDSGSSDSGGDGSDSSGAPPEEPKGDDGSMGTPDGSGGDGNSGERPGMFGGGDGGPGGTSPDADLERGGRPGGTGSTGGGSGTGSGSGGEGGLDTNSGGQVGGLRPGAGSGRVAPSDGVGTNTGDPVA